MKTAMTSSGCRVARPARFSRVHASRSAVSRGVVEGRGGLEDDAQSCSAGTERLHVVGERLVAPAMTFVLLRVLQEIAVELPEVVLGEVDDLPGREDGVDGIRAAGHLLLVARRERSNVEAGEELLHFPVVQHRPLYTRGRADALDRRDTPQAGQPLRGETPEGQPRALELVDLRDESEDLAGDLQRREVG